MYSIILLVCLVLLATTYFINKEGFLSDYSDYTQIDRIRNSEVEFAYCVGGHIVCPLDGSLNRIYDRYKGGFTYESLCSNDKYAQCKNSIGYKTNELLWETPIRGINFPFSDTYKGFSVPYTYIPTEISGNYINFYDNSNNLIDNIHKCDMLQSQSESDECVNQIKLTEQRIQEEKDRIARLKAEQEAAEKAWQESLLNAGANALPDLFKKKCKNPAKCIANYGTNVGDKLCCDQKGVLQKSARHYVCPSSKPTCSDYVCGEKYGTCS